MINNITKKINCSVHEISDIKTFPNSMTVEDIVIQSSNIGTIKIAQQIGVEKYKNFLNTINILKSPEFELDEVGSPIPFKWRKCKLETISFGHGITVTPLQATAAYASIVNGGRLVLPTLIKNKNDNKEFKQIISESTSKKIREILRKVVTDEKGTGSLANIHGYNVSGKTGTSQYYKDKNKNINTFISKITEENMNEYQITNINDSRTLEEENKLVQENFDRCLKKIKSLDEINITIIKGKGEKVNNNSKENYIDKELYTDKEKLVNDLTEYKNSYDKFYYKKRICIFNPDTKHCNITYQNDIPLYDMGKQGKGIHKMNFDYNDTTLQHAYILDDKMNPNNNSWLSQR